MLRTLRFRSAISAETVYQGDSLRLIERSGAIVELRFDRVGDAINKFDRRTIGELRAAVKLLAGIADLRGVLVTSAKDSFIVGADIGEFESRFRASEDDLARSLWSDNEVFIAFEDLAVPTVVALKGFALGGGCELALTATYRVMAADARIGVPEVGLGLFPGLGGTVRLPRVASPTVAVDWIVGGDAHGADDALTCAVVDEVCAPDDVETVALRWLDDAVAGRLDWRTRQAAKRAPVPLPASTLKTVFAAALARCDHRDTTTPHQPAARMAVMLMADTTRLSRDAAQWQECIAFSKVARTQAGRALVQTFLNEQVVRRTSRDHARRVETPLRVALPADRSGIERLAGSPKLVIVDARSAVARIVRTNDVGLDALARGDADADAAQAIVVLLGASTDVATIAARLPGPTRVVGLRLHAGNDTRALAEIVRGAATHDDAVACAVTIALALGATPIVVRDTPVALIERLRKAASCGSEHATGDEHAAGRMAPLIAAAAELLEQRIVATPAEVDVAVSLAARLPPHLGGPLQLADHIGLPRVIEALEQLAGRVPFLIPTADMRERARTGRRYHQTEAAS